MRRWLMTLAGCSLLLVALVLFKVMEIRAAIAFAESFPEHSETVEVYRSESIDYVASITVPGYVLAPRSVTLRNEQAGRIVEVNFASSGKVEAGQLLLQLDVSEEAARLKATQARCRLADTVYRRKAKLHQRGALSQEELDVASAELSALEADVVALQSSIRKKTIRAPFAGTAGLHEFEVGQYLPVNTEITRLVALGNDMWVDFQVPQFYPSLEPGLLVEIDSISERPGNQAVYQGRLLAQSNVIDPGSRSRTYRAALFSEGELPLANSVVKVVVPVAPPESLVKVPAPALQNDLLGQYVYVLSPEEAASARQGLYFRAQRRQVTITGRSADFVYIRQGLKLGERIAAAGAFKLHEGMLVRAGERRVLDGTRAAQDSGLEQQAEGSDPAQ